jgi:hypothetical protein
MLTEEKLRQENRQLLDINRRLEAQKDEYRAKVDAYDAKRKEQINKTNNELQVCHKTEKEKSNDDLSFYSFFKIRIS